MGIVMWLRCKDSACIVGDPGSIPLSGRFPGEGNDYPLSILAWEIHRQRSLESYYSLWGRKKLKTIEQVSTCL